jgi:hypothetical protein
VSVPLGAYVRASRAGAIFGVHLKEFEARYLQGKRPLELALLDVGGAFHVELLRRLIAKSNSNSTSTPVTSDDARVADLYRRFRIGVTAAAAAAAKHPVRTQSANANSNANSHSHSNSNSHSKNTLVGYATTDAVLLYDAGATGAEVRWRQAPPADFGIGRRHRENDIVVGFVVSDAGTASAKFKLRPPLQRLRGASSAKTDNRTIERGAVCETRPREELDGYARRLRAALAAASRPLRAAADGGAAAADGGAAAADGGAAAAAASLKTRASEPRASEPRASEPRESEPRASEPRASEPRASEPRASEPRESEPRASEPRASEPRASENYWPDVDQIEIFTDMGFAAKFDRAAAKRFPSAGELCDAIRLHLLELEERARAAPDGMARGARWVYLFADRAPNVASKA